MLKVQEMKEETKTATNYSRKKEKEKSLLVDNIFFSGSSFYIFNATKTSGSSKISVQRHKKRSSNSHGCSPTLLLHSTIA